LRRTDFVVPRSGSARRTARAKKNRAEKSGKARRGRREKPGNAGAENTEKPGNAGECPDMPVCFAAAPSVPSPVGRCLLSRANDADVYEC
jgi:hypothetical protein